MPTESDHLGDIRDLIRSQLSSLSSVQLERTSKGVNVVVKSYGPDVLEAARLAEQEFDRLDHKYNGISAT